MLDAVLPESRAIGVVDEVLAGCCSRKFVDQKLKQCPGKDVPLYKPSIQTWAYSCHNQESEYNVVPAQVEKVAQCTVSLTREKALLLQNDLLKAFTSPAFQRKLHELARKHDAVNGKTPAYKFAFQRLVRGEQIRVIKNHGFRASGEGVSDMLLAFAEFEKDPDVFVNSEAINEALFSAARPAAPLERSWATRGDKPRIAWEVLELLRLIVEEFSLPDFQAEIEDLKLEEAVQRNVSSGYYHLTGRPELALSYQASILPLYGFEASQEGIQDMITTCAQYLHLKEVQESFDAINSKLGMSDAACKRFRKLAAALA